MLLFLFLQHNFIMFLMFEGVKEINIDLIQPRLPAAKKPHSQNISTLSVCLLADPLSQCWQLRNPHRLTTTSGHKHFYAHRINEVQHTAARRRRCSHRGKPAWEVGGRTKSLPAWVKIPPHSGVWRLSAACQFVKHTHRHLSPPLIHQSVPHSHYLAAHYHSAFLVFFCFLVWSILDLPRFFLSTSFWFFFTFSHFHLVCGVMSDKGI